jgi:hypothetical protein
MSEPAATPTSSESSPDHETVRRLGRRPVALVFLLTFLIYSASPVRQNYDSYLAFPTAQSIVHDRDLYLDEFDAAPILSHAGLVEVADGRVANYFPWVPTLLLVPSIVALDLAGVAGVGSGSFAVANGGSMDIIQMLTASLVVAAVAALLVVISFERLSSSIRHRRRYAVVTALLFAFGTSAWSTASRAVWQHGPSMLCLAAAVLLGQRLLTRSTSRPALTATLLGVAVALSYTVRPTNSIVVIVLTLLVFVALRSSIRWYLLGAAVVAGPWIAVNLIMYESLLPPYYTGSRLSFHDDFFEALAANLVSPARGLLVFTPILLFAAFRWTKSGDQYVRRELRPLDVALTSIVGLYLVAVSSLSDNWWAGHSYGPRFMSDTLVLLACLLVPLGPMIVGAWERLRTERRFGPDSALAAGVVIALAWGVVVNAQGALMRSTLCWNGDPNIDQNVERVWAVTDGQVVSGFVALVEDGPREAFLTDCR